jgi:tRNA(Arg) A34 adenosine deaminase TadA
MNRRETPPAGAGSPTSDPDRAHLQRAVEIALDAEAAGNLPIGAVIVLDGEVLATGRNRIHSPVAHPGRHAEIEALGGIPEELIGRLPEMTCFTTLEPCLMCFGTLVLHEVGRVVFGAHDPVGGATHLIEQLPAYVRDRARRMNWIGPAAPELCGPLWQRIAARYGFPPS